MAQEHPTRPSDLFARLFDPMDAVGDGMVEFFTPKQPSTTSSLPPAVTVSLSYAALQRNLERLEGELTARRASFLNDPAVRRWVDRGQNLIALAYMIGAKENESGGPSHLAVANGLKAIEILMAKKPVLTTILPQALDAMEGLQSIGDAEVAVGEILASAFLEDASHDSDFADEVAEAVRLEVDGGVGMMKTLSADPQALITLRFSSEESEQLRALAERSGVEIGPILSSPTASFPS